MRTTKDTNAIEEEFDSFNRHSGDTEIYLNEMLTEEDQPVPHTQGRFNVAKYSPWINHLLKVNKYLFSVLDISIKTQLENLEEVKKSIQDKIDASSLPSSRSFSITRGGSRRNNVDYMKPPSSSTSPPQLYKWQTT